MIMCLHCTLIICGKCVVIVMKIFFSIHKLLVLNKDFVFFMQNMIFLFVGEFWPGQFLDLPWKCAYW